MGCLCMGFRVPQRYGGRKGSGPSGVVAEVDERDKFGVSQRFVRLCHSSWGLILVLVKLQVWSGSAT